MKPPAFTYHRPTTLGEALETLAATGPDGKVLAGGQSLVPVLNMRLAAPGHLVDINRLTELAYVRHDGGAVRVGALTRHADLERAPAAAAIPLLGEATRHIAHPTIRNRGTTVGSLAHADPAAEMPAVLALLGGHVELASTAGQRVVPAADFFLGPLESAVRPGELAVAAVFPVPAGRTGSAWREVSRRHGDFALCGVGALVTLDDDGLVAAARVVCISVGPVPMVVDVTDAVAGRPVDTADWAAAGALASGKVDPDGDIHASAAYRRNLVGVLTARALAAAASSAAAVPAVPREAPAPASNFTEVVPSEPVSSDNFREAATASATESTGVRDISLTVNGVPRPVRVPARRLLADCLRTDLGLTGTHLGCEHGVCGACTVLVDGRPMRSCLLFAASVDGAEITTVEGCRAPDGGLGPVQQAFVDCHGLQCGFCTPGFITTITAYLRENPDPDAAQAREAIGGNLCRCTGYQNIVASVLRAAAIQKAAIQKAAIQKAAIQKAAIQKAGPQREEQA